MRAAILGGATLTLLGLLTPVTAHAVEGSWVTYLSNNDVREIAITAEGIWGATSGGAIFFDFSRGEFRVWNRAPGGLASDTLTSVAVLEDGKIAFATATSGVSLYEPRRGLWFHETELTWDIASNAVRFIREEPPWRIIGSDGGFVALREGAVELPCKEGLDLCGLPGWDISAGIHHDDALWLGATAGEELGGVGRFRAELGWDTLNSDLPSLDVTDFAVWSDSLFVATTKGVMVWDGTAWLPRSGGLPNQITICGLFSGSRLLCAACGDNGGVFAYEHGAGRWSRLGSDILQAHCVAEAPDGTVWAGMSAARLDRAYLQGDEDGIWELVGEQWLQHRREGPHAVSSYRALAVDSAGRVWAASEGREVGWRINRFDEEGWTYLHTSNTDLTNAWVFNIHFVDDEVWVGHCCCGTPASCPLDRLDPGTGAATAIDSLGNVYDSSSDTFGNIWFASWHETNEAAAQGIYHWNRATDHWTIYSTESTGGLVRANRVAAVAAIGDRLWIGYDSEGIDVVRITADGLSLAAQDWTEYRAEEGEGVLPSDRVTALAAGGDAVWVGTDSGVSLLSAGDWRIFYPSPYGLPGGEVKDLCLTSDGAAWVGVWGHGVTRIERAPTGEYTFQRFEPPELVNPDVWVLATGAAGRDVWVGTNQGLAHFVPSAPVESVSGDAVDLYPNPFNPACGGEVRLKNLPGQASRGLVVDVAGRVLTRFTEKWEGEPFWDGRDLDGELVAPGLYIVRVATPQGWLTGHLALVDLPCEGW